MLSLGVPMLLGGDELGRTQLGNNNAYCQDNAISWYDWNTSPEQDELTAFVAYLCQLRKAHPSLRRRVFLHTDPDGSPEGSWYRPDGEPMTVQDWQSSQSRAVTLDLRAEPIADADTDVDDALLLLVNSWWEPLPFVLPTHVGEVSWTAILNTADLAVRGDAAVRVDSAAGVVLDARSLVVLRAEPSSG